MLEKVIADRAAKLEKIRQLGIDPYGGRYNAVKPISEILVKFEEWENQTADGKMSSVPEGESPSTREKIRGVAAGRIILYRDMGKMMFAHIRDQSDKMQIALRKNALDEKAWQLAGLLDLGDIVAVEGPIERTKTREVTIWADKLTLLCKSLNPMPEKFHGLQDTETRYRRRYLDLMANPKSMAVFKKRIEIIDNFRQTLRAKKFVEVETPALQPIYGGAAAKPFTTHHNALDINLFLRISPELYLKRLLVGGMTKVFEIARNFRNEGIDARHNPEFTMMELYQAYADYEVMMEITEELVYENALRNSTMEALGNRRSATLAEDSELDKAFKVFTRDFNKQIKAGFTAAEQKNVKAAEEALVFSEFLLSQSKAIAQAGADIFQKRLLGMDRCAKLLAQGRTALEYGSVAIDFTRPWRKRNYYDLVADYAKVDPRNQAAVRDKALRLGIEASNKDDAVVVNEVFEAAVEPELAKPDDDGVVYPTFVIDYPAELCPLTRRKADDPSIALRFELYIAGMEIANAYTELNDPAVQEANFHQQLKGEAEGETMRVMDEDFVMALRHGMPPAGGLGIGIDRVVMLLTNSQSIRDVVLFPTLRPEAK